jgi:hypothetical protein
MYEFRKFYDDYQAQKIVNEKLKKTNQLQFAFRIVNIS